MGHSQLRLGAVCLMATLVASPALAQSKEPIALRDMGSFHVGGRLIEVKGQPIKEVLFTPGGVPASPVSGCLQPAACLGKARVTAAVRLDTWSLA